MKPEEAKERGEEEVSQIDYVPTFTLGAEKWLTEVVDPQWESKAPVALGIVPPIRSWYCIGYTILAL